MNKYEKDMNTLEQGVRNPEKLVVSLKKKAVVSMLNMEDYLDVSSMLYQIVVSEKASGYVVDTRSNLYFAKI
jgi:hypothetical protein